MNTFECGQGSENMADKKQQVARQLHESERDLRKHQLSNEYLVRMCSR